jgi:hypothetical protein
LAGARAIVCINALTFESFTLYVKSYEESDFEAASFFLPRAAPMSAADFKKNLIRCTTAIPSTFALAVSHKKRKKEQHCICTVSASKKELKKSLKNHNVRNSFGHLFIEGNKREKSIHYTL